MQFSPNIFPNLKLKLFFKYKNDFLAIWMDDMLIYSQTEEEHLKHIYIHIHIN